MRKIALSVSLVAAATLADVGGTTAAPVEYVKICSLYGADFFYIPGTDICLNPTNGDTRQQTAFGTLRTLSPMAQDIAVLQGQVGDLNNQTAALQSAQQALQARFDADFRNANDGSAIAMALEDPYLTESEHFGFKVNWG
jgi:Porin subfamily